MSAFHITSSRARTRVHHNFSLVAGYSSAPVSRCMEQMSSYLIVLYPLQSLVSTRKSVKCFTRNFPYTFLAAIMNPIPDNNAANAPTMQAMPMSPNIIIPIKIPIMPKMISKIPITFMSRSSLSYV